MLRKEGKIKDCLMCSPSSVEVSNSGKAILVLSQSDLGINCGICNCFCCQTCLEKIVAVFPNDMKIINHWYMYVTAFLSEEKRALPLHACYPSGPFIGHCCVLGFFQRRPPTSIQELTRFDRCLFLPQYKLIINPCFAPDGMVDIHGFGAFLPYFTGVIHCVLSLKSCVEYESMGSHANRARIKFQIGGKRLYDTQIHVAI